MNESIFFFFHNIAHRASFFDNVIIFFGFWFPYIVVMLAGLFLLFHHDVFKSPNPFVILYRKKKEILLSFFSGSLAWIIAKILKVIIAIPRPLDLFTGVQPILVESGHAFPSGHAAFFMALAVSLFFYHKKAGYLFIFFALLIGLARIVGGAHSPVDILGGFVLGFLVEALVAYFAKNR